MDTRVICIMYLERKKIECVTLLSITNTIEKGVRQVRSSMEHMFSAVRSLHKCSSSYIHTYNARTHLCQEFVHPTCLCWYLNPSVSECEIVWKQGLHRVSEIKMKSLGWSYNQYDWCPYEKGTTFTTWIHIERLIVKRHWESMISV